MILFVYNNAIYLIIKIILFYINYNYNSILTGELKRKVLIIVNVKKVFSIFKYFYI